MEDHNDRPHKRLDLWKRAMEMVIVVYEATRGFPREEMYGLTAQLRRAAVSVPSNIAEGLTRRSIADKLHFLNFSQASLSEIDTQIEIAARLGFLGEEKYGIVQERLIHVQRLLGGLIRSIVAKRK